MSPIRAADPREFLSLREHGAVHRWQWGPGFTVRTVSKSASVNGSVKPKRVAATKANPAQTQSPTPANVAPPGQSDKIRAWARSQGMQVADAGRMSAAVIAAYEAHHN